MPLDPPPVWGQNIANLITALGITDSAPITPAQLAQVWTAVKTEDTAQLGKSAVAPGTFVAPAMGGPVTGVGGPVT